MPDLKVQEFWKQHQQQQYPYPTLEQLHNKRQAAVIVMSMN